MQNVNVGILPQSLCISFTPSDLAKKLYYYPTLCGHYFCSNEYLVKRENYPDLLLIYVIEGKLHLEYQTETLIANNGEVLLLDCRQPHHYYASSDLEFLYIHFNGVNSRDIYQQIIQTHGYLFHSKHSIQIGQILYNLIEQSNKNHLIDAPAFSLLIYQLIIELSSSPTGSEQLRLTIMRAINYIQRNVGKKITLGELADHSNLSRCYFSRLFKAETGYSPQEYVISSRLDKAKVLLKTSKLSLSEIAYQVGYENTGSFINVFCKRIGISPTSFRSNNN